jgi:hypothetical protein
VTTSSRKTAAKSTAAKVVRHGSVTRSAAARSTATDLGIDRETLLRNLVKFSRSTDEAIAFAATKELLNFVK